MTQTQSSKNWHFLPAKKQKEPISKQGKRQPNVKNVKNGKRRKEILLKCARLLPQMVPVNPQNLAPDSQEEQTDSGKGHILILPGHCRGEGKGLPGTDGRGLLNNQD